ncbi:hypothetical protein [Sciscionella marina]|uniref:hypothetical protein n=1 Tax=Sciscionella marina TaxID=508770 RepID=UPI00037FA1F9|nr:hypothetical protein [Sciscionella marina]
MRWFLDHGSDTGSPLVALPCEYDPNPLGTWLHGLRNVPALMPVHEGDATSYSRLPTYRLRPGARLEPHQLEQGLVEHVRKSLQARRRIRPGITVPQLVSVLHPLDMATTCFSGPTAGLGHHTVFRDTVRRELTTLHDQHRVQLRYQLTTLAIPALFERTPRRLWSALAVATAHNTATVITCLPRTARWILHWCTGDLGGEPLLEPRGLWAPVHFANALHRRLSAHQYPTPLMHIPLSDTITIPSTDPAYYQPFTKLNPRVPISAGLVHELAPEDATTALALVERALGRRVDALSAACGLGHRSPYAAEGNARLARHLSEGP